VFIPDLINFYRLEEVKAIEFSRTMVEFRFFTILMDFQILCP